MVDRDPSSGSFADRLTESLRAVEQNSPQRTTILANACEKVATPEDSRVLAEAAAVELSGVRVARVLVRRLFQAMPDKIEDSLRLIGASIGTASQVSRRNQNRERVDSFSMGVVEAIIGQVSPDTFLLFDKAGGITSKTWQQFLAGAPRDEAKLELVSDKLSVDGLRPHISEKTLRSQAPELVKSVAGAALDQARYAPGVNVEVLDKILAACQQPIRYPTIGGPTTEIKLELLNRSAMAVVKFDNVQDIAPLGTDDVVGNAARALAILQRFSLRNKKHPIPGGTYTWFITNLVEADRPERRPTRLSLGDAALRYVGAAPGERRKLVSLARRDGVAAADAHWAKERPRDGR